MDFSLRLSSGFVDRKLDFSLVRFDRVFVRLLALGADAVSVAAVVAHASVIKSGVR